MAAKDDEGDVFAIPEFWRPSKWLTQANVDPAGSFFALDMESNNHPREFDFLPYPDTGLSDEGFFKLPVALGSDAATTQIPDDNDKSTAEETIEEDNNADKIWEDLEFVPEKPNCKTWEDFNDRRTVAHRPMFLSEAGSSAYDSLLQEPEDYLQLGNSGVRLVNQQAYFSCLLHVALAQESELFKKDERSAEFISTLANIRIPGYSRQVLYAVEQECAACGKLAMDLATFAKKVYSQQPSHCAVAFASTVIQVLDVIRKHAVVDTPTPKSILNLQNTIRSMASILRPLEILSREMNDSSTDEEVLTILFNYASISDNSDTYTRDISREILQIVSCTWVEFIEEWIGTRPERGIPLSRKDIGTGKGFVKVGTQTFIDDFGREIQDVDFVMVEANIPEFMPPEIAASIFQTGRNLRFIKEFHPQHSLARDDVLSELAPPKASWLYNWSDILQLGAEAAAYRDRAVGAIESAPQNKSPQEVPVLGSAASALTFFGCSDDELEARLQVSMQTLNLPPQHPQRDGPLAGIIQRRLQAETASAVTAGQEPHWSLVPVLSFGNLALIQAQLVGRESLKLLFDKHGLHMHLKLQHQFQLLGNGLFCSRLSHALFDPDLETTERRAGVAREGGLMGLRLGGRDTWPPASSELRLALMGVLKETCDSVTVVAGKSSHTRGQQELPGDLSFAIRDLSEDDIQKCRDVDSLEALDFLRLSYTSPPELSAIITPMALLQYDRIFRLLLRVLRMLYTVNMIFRDINFGWGRFSYVDDVRYRFVREAHHIVTCISAYFLDSGVSIPWTKFEQGLDRVRSELDIPFAQQAATTAIIGPQQVCELQETMLDQITQNLFLRKRQQPILELLEGMFGCILRYAKYMRLEELRRHQELKELEEPAAIYNDFKKHVQMFLIVCRELAEKARLSAGSRDRDSARDTADASLLSQLLTKLDLYDYYAT